MSLSLLPHTSAVMPNLTIPFVGTGGTLPYTYSVQGGGAGGTINASSGVYTSPNNTGVDTILVTDALAATAQSTVLVGNALELFCDVIQTSMGLANGRVYLWDQKINAPTDNDVFVVVGVVSAKPFGNTNSFDPVLGSIQSVNMQAMLSVDIISRGPAARDRKEEIILALNSTYSEQQQELNSFRIFPISSGFVNLSQEDGAAIPYRFNISCHVQYYVTKTTTIAYFDDFSPVGVTTEP